jgi:methylated-DNA-protein-cysteine methyltransferase-like protein
MSAGGKGWTSVYRVVKRVPQGRVATYGQIAALAGMPGAARQVGWALNALQEEEDVPWHRVINAKGEISGRGDRAYEDFQRALLEAEGVEFGRGGRVDLERFAWKPGGRRPSRSVARSTDQRAVNPARRKA